MVKVRTMQYRAMTTSIDCFDVSLIKQYIKKSVSAEAVYLREYIDNDSFRVIYLKNI